MSEPGVLAGLLGCCCGLSSLGEELYRDWENHPACQQYTIRKRLGEGGFSEVHLAEDKITGKTVALKVVFLNKSGLNAEQRKILAGESRLIRMVMHPNIVRCMQVLETRRQQVLVLEHLSGGEMLRQLQKMKRYTEACACQLFKQIAAAVAYLHSLGIMHRDIKPENCLLAKPASHYAAKHKPVKVKVIDLGMAGLHRPKKPCHGCMGSPGFIAPEVILGDPHTPAMDVYSLGVLLFIMLVGRKPWDSQRSHTLAYAVQPTCEAPGLCDPMYLALSPPAKQLLLSMLCEDATRRPSVQQVLGHTWVLQGGCCKGGAAVAAGGTNPERLHQEALQQRLQVLAHSREILGTARGMMVLHGRGSKAQAVMFHRAVKAARLKLQQQAAALQAAGQLPIEQVQLPQQPEQQQLLMSAAGVRVAATPAGRHVGPGGGLCAGNASSTTGRSEVHAEGNTGGPHAVASVSGNALGHGDVAAGSKDSGTTTAGPVGGLGTALDLARPVSAGPVTQGDASVGERELGRRIKSATVAQLARASLQQKPGLLLGALQQQQRQQQQQSQRPAAAGNVLHASKRSAARSSPGCDPAAAAGGTSGAAAGPSPPLVCDALERGMSAPNPDVLPFSPTATHALGLGIRRREWAISVSPGAVALLDADDRMCLLAAAGTSIDADDADDAALLSAAALNWGRHGSAELVASFKQHYPVKAAVRSIKARLSQSLSSLSRSISRSLRTPGRLSSNSGVGYMAAAAAAAVAAVAASPTADGHAADAGLASCDSWTSSSSRHIHVMHTLQGDPGAGALAEEASAEEQLHKAGATGTVSGVNNLQQPTQENSSRSAQPLQSAFANHQPSHASGIRGSAHWGRAGTVSSRAVSARAGRAAGPATVAAAASASRYSSDNGTEQAAFLGTQLSMSVGSRQTSGLWGEMSTENPSPSCSARCSISDAGLVNPGHQAEQHQQQQQRMAQHRHAGGPTPPAPAAAATAVAGADQVTRHRQQQQQWQPTAVPWDPSHPVYAAPQAASSLLSSSRTLQASAFAGHDGFLAAAAVAGSSSPSLLSRSMRAAATAAAARAEEEGIGLPNGLWLQQSQSLDRAIFVNAIALVQRRSTDQASEADALLKASSMISRSSGCMSPRGTLPDAAAAAEQLESNAADVPCAAPSAQAGAVCSAGTAAVSGDAQQTAATVEAAAVENADEAAAAAEFEADASDFCLPEGRVSSGLHNRDVSMISWLDSGGLLDGLNAFRQQQHSNLELHSDCGPFLSTAAHALRTSSGSSCRLVVGMPADGGQLEPGSRTAVQAAGTSQAVTVPAAAAGSPSHRGRYTGWAHLERSSSSNGGAAGLQRQYNHTTCGAGAGVEAATAAANGMPIAGCAAAAEAANSVDKEFYVGSFWGPHGLAGGHRMGLAGASGRSGNFQGQSSLQPSSLQGSLADELRLEAAASCTPPAAAPEGVEIVGMETEGAALISQLSGCGSSAAAAAAAAAECCQPDEHCPDWTKTAEAVHSAAAHAAFPAGIGPSRMHSLAPAAAPVTLTEAIVLSGRPYIATDGSAQLNNIASPYCRSLPAIQQPVGVSQGQRGSVRSAGQAFACVAHNVADHSQQIQPPFDAFDEPNPGAWYYA